MKLLAFTIFDTKAQAYGRPFFNHTIPEPSARSPMRSMLPTLPSSGIRKIIFSSMWGRMTTLAASSRLVTRFLSGLPRTSKLS